MRNGLNCSEAGRLGAIKANIKNIEKKILRIETYNKDPKLCKFCKTAISYEKKRLTFCNHSCATSFNNIGVRRHGITPITPINFDKNKSIKDNYILRSKVACLFCNKISLNEKFCSQVCYKNFQWKCFKDKLLLNGYDTSFNAIHAKKYLVELHNNKCQVCQLSEWNNTPMPLVLDHIDGNSNNNNLINLRVICNNCDALSPTFKGKNRGNGRFIRRQRYAENKSS